MRSLRVRRSAAFLPLVAVVVAGGCKVDQAAEVDTYRSVLDTGLNATEQGPIEFPAPTDELGVRTAMRLASLRNERLDIEGERYLQWIIDRRRAAAAFLPTIGLSPSYVLRDRVAGLRRSLFDVPLDAFMVFNPVADAYAISEADARILVARAELLAAQDALLLDTARSVYEVIRAERQVLVFARSIELQQERVRDAEIRREVGLISPLDVSLSRSALADTRARAIDAGAQVHQGRAILSFLANVDAHEVPLLDDLGSEAIVPELEWLDAEARRWRPELAAAQAAIMAADAAVESAYGEYWPSVALDVRVFLTRQSEPSNLDWTSLFALHIPIFSAGLIEADVRTALSQARAARQAESLLRREIVRDIESARIGMLAARDRVIQRTLDVEAAQQALTQAEGLYAAGLAVNLERLEAQDRLLNAQLELVGAELDERIFRLDVLRAIGRIHEVAGLVREPIDGSTSGPADNGDQTMPTEVTHASVG